MWGGRTSSGSTDGDARFGNRDSPSINRSCNAMSYHHCERENQKRVILLYTPSCSFAVLT